MSLLFQPWSLRSVTMRNRIMLSPMCQYSARDGLAQDWHLVHLGARAVFGVGLIMVEATAVEKRGRISPEDLCLEHEAHATALRPITNFIKQQGAVPAIQLAHAGGKAGSYAPWRGSGFVPRDQGGWQAVAPSRLAFAPHYPLPNELDEKDLRELTGRFVQSTRLAESAGFLAIELHMAHGYLLHQFLSPLSNHRRDAYGGSLEARMRFPLEVVAAVRQAWPAHLPLLVRLSVTDWVEGGWSVDDSIIMAQELKERGVDAIDCSSGGSSPKAKIPVGPGYQVPLAARLRHESGLPTIAVGMIESGAQAEAILQRGDADAVAIGRALLRNPQWAVQAAQELGWPMPKVPQYARA